MLIPVRSRLSERDQGALRVPMGPKTAAVGAETIITRASPGVRAESPETTSYNTQEGDTLTQESPTSRI